MADMNFFKNLYEFRNKHHRIMPPFIAKIPAAFAINQKHISPGMSISPGEEKEKGAKSKLKLQLSTFFGETIDKQRRMIYNRVGRKSLGNTRTVAARSL